MLTIGVSEETLSITEFVNPKKWRGIFRVEGYTTSAKREGLVREFHNVVETFEGAGVDVEVFLLVEGDAVVGTEQFEK